MTIRSYVEMQFKGISDSEEKSNIMEELILNMSEQVDDLVEKGKELEDAINKVVVDFGDMSELKNELIEKEVSPLLRLKVLLSFSIWGAILISALAIFINLTTTPGYLWCVYPIFAVIWWPLAMFYRFKLKGKV
jgi:hypothetical protein